MKKSTVAVVSKPELSYPSVPPFDPPNPVYAAVCELLEAMGLDRERLGTGEWNPLGEFVPSGGRIVIKPNLVTSRDFQRDLSDEDLLCSSTHASVLRPLIEFALRAVGPQGSVVVLDCPLEGSNFQRTAQALGVTRMLAALEAHHQRSIPLVDLRIFRLGRKMLLDDVRIGGRSWNAGVLYPRSLPGDPRGVATVDLGKDSAFVNHIGSPRQLRFHRSHKRSPVPHHSGGRNEYRLAQTVLDADLVVTVPKLKTHQKAGATLSMKSVIGLSPNKYWLPHYTAGPPPLGDEYPQAPPLAARLIHQLSRFPLPGGCSGVLRAPELSGSERTISEGSWHRNDTIWRTVVDLNRVLLYADKNGVLQQMKQRHCLNIVDGVIAGEGEGPLAATAKHCGVLIGGLNALAVDTVACTIMGIDPQAIGYIRGAQELKLYPLVDYDRIETNLVGNVMPRFSFRLPFGWESTRLEVG